MKVLIDMNLPPSWVDFFKQEGIEAVHWSTIGPSNAPDFQIMLLARQDGWIVFTHDLDFGALLAATRMEGPSVFQIRTQNVLPQSIGPLVIQVIHQFREILMEGALVSVDEHSSNEEQMCFDHSLNPYNDSVVLHLEACHVSQHSDHHTPDNAH